MTFAEALAFLQTREPLRVTISGAIGSGKSTTAERLAKTLEIPRIYVGQMMRDEAKARGLTLDAFNALLEKDDTIDRAMDAKQKEIGQATPRGIFEGRTAWHFIESPDCKLMLTVDKTVSATRIFNDKTGNRDLYPTLEAVLEANETRKQNEIARYSRYYGIDIYDLKNYDVVIDTTPLSRDEVFETVVIAIAEFLQK